MTTPQIFNPQVGANPVAASPMNANWFSGVKDLLSVGLDGWMKYEQVQAYKDAGTLGQLELTSTVQTPNPNTDQTFVDPKKMQEQQQNFAEKAGDFLQTGVGVAAAIVAGVGLLYFLTRK